MTAPSKVSEARPQVVRLADYRPPDYLVDIVALDVSLHPSASLIASRLTIRANPAGTPGAPLILDGDGLTLVSIRIDGMTPDADVFVATPDRLTVFVPPEQPFVVEIQTRLDPTANTQLMGLYRSNGTYCTQCEAEGFRRITYFPDRPDVLSVYTVRIEASLDESPVLLANGNRAEFGVCADGRHYAIWHDPWPKPAYLFAMVAGDLAHMSDRFVTMSGRNVELGLYVERGKEGRVGWAMDCLQRSMRWDETMFGREYDLDVFNIVAVSDFNMGAMENKGLNVFNDRYILAEPQTATDGDYAAIEAIIAHEYFHNWTGNRITCRDWFQLCLKEGLTVFRDQEFSADQRSRAVKRIQDVRTLRAQQFPEDSGPLAHPVRPDSYVEINNFYTATVYEKGAEIIRMLKTLIGDAAFGAGLDQYFSRFDGHAATIEDFLSCFSAASGEDLGPFARWYDQAGTPVVNVAAHHDTQTHEYTLDMSQATAPTPRQTTKMPLVVPIVSGFIDEDGMPMTLGAPLIQGSASMRGETIILDGPYASIRFADVRKRPVASLLRQFSAPVRLEMDLTEIDLETLFAHDADPFNRWQAGQSLSLRLLRRHIDRSADQGSVMTEPRFPAIIGKFIREHAIADPSFAAQILSIPSDTDLARDIGTDIDPDAIHRARMALKSCIGRINREPLEVIEVDLEARSTYNPGARDAGRRSLRHAAFDLLLAGGIAQGEERAARRFDAADNLTDRFASLGLIAQHCPGTRDAALAAFADRYASEPLVLDKWFSLQASLPEAGTIERVRRLMTHPVFSLGNPNRVRALIGGFAALNPTQFNRVDGAGYALVSETVLALDPTNPQVAARLLSAFRVWRTLEPVRRAKAKAALEHVSDSIHLSRDVRDIVGRSLA